MEKEEKITLTTGTTKSRKAEKKPFPVVNCFLSNNEN